MFVPDKPFKVQYVLNDSLEWGHCLKSFGTNALAYLSFCRASNEEKRFMTLAPVANFIKLFTAVSYNFP